MARAKRKAISPVLATVILIAICLIAAVALVGFVFGLFGTFENTGGVTASASLVGNLGPTGQITLYNSGNAPATVMGVTMTYNGQTCQATFTTTGAIPSSGSTNLNIVAGTFPSDACGQPGTTSDPSQGMHYTGQVTLTGGYQIPFVGVFQ